MSRQHSIDSKKYKIQAKTFMVLLLITLFSFSAHAAYVFQTVPGEVFDAPTTNIVWNNDNSQTGFPIDDDYQLVNIGFTFYLGEVGYTQVRVISNGALHFGTDQGFHKDYDNEALPIVSAFNGPGFEEPADRVIAGYWDDLSPALGGTVRYGAFGTASNRRFVVSWQDVRGYNAPASRYSFQIVLYENGNVRFRYANDDAKGASATIGIEVDNSDFTQYSFNTNNAVNDANDILWRRAFPTLVSSTANCTINNRVTLTFASPVSPARAADPTNFSINNGISVLASAYINPTTVQLTTTALSTGITYTVSTTYPTQSTTFSLAVTPTVLANSATPGIGSVTLGSGSNVSISIVGGGGGDGSSTRGGAGATVNGTFNLIAGDIIRYVVAAGSTAANSAGGGGSTGVFINNSLVMVAGGGGGGDNSGGAIGLGGNNTTAGDNGTGTGPGTGGTGGAGGGGVSAGGGGGINSAGGSGGGGQGGQAADLVPGNGVTFVAGGTPGAGGSAGAGGFTGGGGATPNFYSGGAGGYSGGGSAGAGGSAGGGGSYLNTGYPGYISGSLSAGADGAAGGVSGASGANGTINISALLPCGPTKFIITHDGNGINCLREAISIRAVDSGGATVTNYTGTINLSLSTIHGNWFVTNESATSIDLAQGTLTDTAGDNNGLATYQFVAGDSGSVALYLYNTVAETTNINVAEGAITDDNTEGNITFRPFGFVVTPAPMGLQIAGRPFTATLTAAGQTPAQLSCGVIEEYAGNQAINFWSNYTFPVSSPTRININGVNIATNEPASTPQTVNFTAGVATVSVRYDDAGQIRFSAKDQIGIGDPVTGTVDEIIGGITPFIIRPFAYDVQVAGNPIALSASDPVYAIAANNFNMTLRSILWQSVDDSTPVDGLPDTASNLADNGVTPNISLITESIGLTPTAQLVTNSNGVLTINSVNYASFPAPAAVGAGTLTFAQSWNEVGILRISANTANFMGTGVSISGSRSNIGRFRPDHFNLTLTDDFTAQCSGTFNYAGFSNGVAGLNKNGQTDAVAFSVQAVNAANNPTSNYDDVFAKLEAGTISRVPFNVTTALNATGILNSTLSLALGDFTTSGNANITLSNVHYQYDSIAAPFNLRLDFTATDADFVNGVISSSAVAQRLGRLRLIDAYGPETSDLEVKLISEYFSAVNWVTNTADSCTNYVQTEATLNPATYTDNLNPGETAVFSPLALQSVINGSSTISNGLWFSAPGDNNYGSVVVDFNLTTQPWLSFDWDADNVTEAPSALLNFGYYRGSDRVIYWREIRN